MLLISAKTGNELEVYDDIGKKSLFNYQVLEAFTGWL